MPQVSPTKVSEMIDTHEVKRVEFEGRTYIDLLDFSQMCAMMAVIHQAQGLLSGACCIEMLRDALLTILNQSPL